MAVSTEPVLRHTPPMVPDDGVAPDLSDHSLAQSRPSAAQTESLDDKTALAAALSDTSPSAAPAITVSDDSSSGEKAVDAVPAVAALREQGGRRRRASIAPWIEPRLLEISQAARSPSTATPSLRRQLTDTLDDGTDAPNYFDSLEESIYINIFSYLNVKYAAFFVSSWRSLLTHAPASITLPETY